MRIIVIFTINIANNFQQKLKMTFMAKQSRLSHNKSESTFSTENLIKLITAMF